MSRPTRIAVEDAEVLGRPRTVRGFFTSGNGVCSLCGIGLGKRFTHDERRDHEKGYHHIRNHWIYKEAFTPAREEAATAATAAHERARRQKLKDVATELQREFGVEHWIGHGDTTQLKAALFDAMTDPWTDPTNSRVRDEIEAHKQNVRSTVLQQAATVALGGQEDMAFTVTTLVDAYF